MTVKERLTEFLNYRRIGQAKFSSIAGLSRGYVNNKVNTIGPEAQPKIATAFPDLNMAWLLTGPFGRKIGDFAAFLTSDGHRVG